MLSALARKFGQGGFFTIYQDYAKQQLGLTLPESGKGGTIYGGTAGIAVAFISLTHALKWNYSKPVSLAISGLLDGLAIFLISTAKNKVGLGLTAETGAEMDDGCWMPIKPQTKMKKL